MLVARLLLTLMLSVTLTASPSHSDPSSRQNCIETYSGGINMYDTCTGITNHAIALTGYGSENGTDYWIGRNSWGTYWGEHGFFRIVRGGKYQPKRGFWAVPVVPDWK
jgi:hypothetical protein